MQREGDGRPVGVRVAELATQLRLPTSGRANPGRGGLIALATVAVLVALVVGGWVLSSRPHRIPVAAVDASVAGLPAPSAVPSGGGSAPAGASAGPTASAGLVVDVAGKVRHPGVYRLPAGARLQDAVTAAGGMLPGVDPAGVNLARRLTDGEQVLIGLPAAGGAAAGGTVAGGMGVPAGTDPAPAGTGPVDLNTATVAQLDALPGVGPVLAQRMVDWRTQHGRFDSVDDLSKVSGIGPAKLADLKPLVTVS